MKLFNGLMNGILEAAHFINNILEQPPEDSEEYEDEQLPEDTGEVEHAQVAYESDDKI